MSDVSYDQVAPLLFMGAAPDPVKAYTDFDALVLCTEAQPTRFPNFHGTIIRAPFSDTSYVTADLRRIAIRAAREVAKRLRKGQTVLVTCTQGWNRAGLVVGIALKMASRLSSDEIIERIRAARGRDALSNQSFERIVKGFSGRNKQATETRAGATRFPLAFSRPTSSRK